jgi:phage-related tail fiber protein
MTTTDRLRILNGLGVKTPVVCCTTGNVTLSGLQVIDGVQLAAGDRVLVDKQTDEQENGIYVAKSGNWARALDLLTEDDVAAGTLVYVASGTLYGDVLFRLDPL